MKLQEIVQEANERFNLDFVFDETHQCSFSLEDGSLLTLELGAEPETFTLFSPVAKVDPIHALELFPKFMEANLFRQSTGKCTLGYNKSKSYLILFQEFDEKLTTTQSFYDDLSLFIAYLHYWKETIASEKKALHNEEVHAIDEHIASLMGKKQQVILFV